MCHLKGYFWEGDHRKKPETPKMGSSPGSPHFQSNPPGGSEKRANCLFSFEKYKIPKEGAGNRPRQTGSHLPHTPQVAVSPSPEATRVAKSGLVSAWALVGPPPKLPPVCSFRPIQTPGQAGGGALGQSYLLRLGPPPFSPTPCSATSQSTGHLCGN